jgi:hypothetical protein
MSTGVAVEFRVWPGQRRGFLGADPDQQGQHDLAYISAVGLRTSSRPGSSSIVRGLRAAPMTAVACAVTELAGKDVGTVVLVMVRGKGPIPS